MPTPPIIQEYGNKRIPIPRKKPTKILRKPVFSHNPRRTEIAFMSITVVLLNGLGVFLYWKQRKKRAKNCGNDKGLSESSNQELRNEELEYTEETIKHRQELNLGETILKDQLLENNEVSSRNDELKMNSESSQRNDEVEENEAIQIDQEPGGSEANLRHKDLVNTEG